MKIVFFSHPAFMRSQSMPRFAKMLQTAFAARGYATETRSPMAVFSRLAGSTRWAKWAGYIDQYLVFPPIVLAARWRDPADTLYVFCDQALGPWVPLVKYRPHVVHCHDLLALRSALGEIAENPVSPTGRIYQRFIRRGFRQARHFISVSEKSRHDLHRYGGVQADTSEVVYNGLNFPYTPIPPEDAARRLGEAGHEVDARGILLHVGGDQWYKNTAGILKLYARYVREESAPLPLWMVSPPPDAALRRELADIPARGTVRFLQGLDNPLLNAAYGHARAFLFPSLAEGFGWPIVEALACGCPVITTGEAPMNEIGGPACHYLPRLQPGHEREWLDAASRTLMQVLGQSAAERARRAGEGIAWARRFDAAGAIDAYERIYRSVLAPRRGPVHA